MLGSFVFIFLNLIFRMMFIRLNWLPARFECVLSMYMLYHVNWEIV